MLILVLNAAEDSLKCRLLRMPGEEVLAAAQARGIAGAGGQAAIDYRLPSQRIKGRMTLNGHGEALAHFCATLADPDLGAIASLEDIDLVGHRLAAGARLFGGPVLHAPEMEAPLRQAGQHRVRQMEAALALVARAGELLPRAKQFLHFDDAFFLGLPQWAARHALPEAWNHELADFCGGVHGLAHEGNCRAALWELEAMAGDLRVISVHLGSQASLSAVDRGRPVAVSSLFTPQGGAPCATGPGCLDPRMLPFLSQRLGLSLAEVLETAGRQGGWKAISGLAGGWAALEKAREQGHPGANLAFDFWLGKLKAWLGGMFFTMGGADAVVISGGIGKNSPLVRAALLGGLESFGLMVAEYANLGLTGGKSGRFNHKDSTVKLVVAEASEELTIARAAQDEISG